MHRYLGKAEETSKHYLSSMFDILSIPIQHSHQLASASLATYFSTQAKYRIPRLFLQPRRFVKIDDVDIFRSLYYIVTGKFYTSKHLSNLATKCYPSIAIPITLIAKLRLNK